MATKIEIETAFKLLCDASRKPAEFVSRIGEIRTALSLQTVDNLKSIFGDTGLSKTGKKADLIERFATFIASGGTTGVKKTDPKADKKQQLEKAFELIRAALASKETDHSPNRNAICAALDTIPATSKTGKCLAELCKAHKIPHSGKKAVIGNRILVRLGLAEPLNKFTVMRDSEIEIEDMETSELRKLLDRAARIKKAREERAAWLTVGQNAV